MRKLLCLLLVLALVGCGGQADEIARLEAERDQAVAELQAFVAEMEEEHRSQAAAEAEILASFMANLDSVGEFLGIDDLYSLINEDSIVIRDSFVTVGGGWHGNGMGFTLLYRVQGRNRNISWNILSYGIGPIGGPRPLDSGRSWWRWEQERLFDESFTVRFYSYHEFSPQPIYEYVDEEILPEDWQGQVISHMLTHNNIRLADLWYEGTRLVVDITPAGAVPFNWGSHGSGMRGLSLLTSLATLPGVTEIELLVGGQRGVYVDHFNFGGVTRVDGDGRIIRSTY